jgi:hypothetical protein
MGRALDVLFEVLDRLPADFAAMLVVDALNAGQPNQVTQLVVHPRFAEWGAKHGPTFVARASGHATELARTVLDAELPPALALPASLRDAEDPE